MLIGVSLLVGVAALVGFWWLRVRRGSQERLPPQDEGPAHDGKPALLAAIAALDDEFEAGRIGADEYHARREELKGRALQAMGDRDD
jgi:hypothetical protein